jgi:hypothetical protein
LPDGSEGVHADGSGGGTTDSCTAAIIIERDIAAVKN